MLWSILIPDQWVVNESHFQIFLCYLSLLFSSWTSKSWRQVSRKFHLCFSWCPNKLTNYFEGTDLLPKMHLLILSSTSSMPYFLDSKTSPSMSRIINLITDFWKPNIMFYSEFNDSSKSFLSMDSNHSDRIPPSVLPSLSNQEIYYLTYLEVLRSNKLQRWVIQLVNNVIKVAARVPFTALPFWLDWRPLQAAGWSVSSTASRKRNGLPPFFS